MLYKVLTLTTFVGGCLCVPGSVLGSESELDRSIARHRMGTLTVLAKPEQEVRVEQVRHEFWFGAAISSGPFDWQANSPNATKYKEVFLENFNAAVTENALKWHAMERKQGAVDNSIVDAILEWTTKHEIPLRGPFQVDPQHRHDWRILKGCLSP